MKTTLSNCRKGDLAEMLLMAAAIANDFEVFTPHGHAQAADLCLVRPGCRPLLVQVKTAEIRRNIYSINVSRGTGSKVAYSEGDFDVLAAYLPDINQFVFWTIPDLRGRKRLSYSPRLHRQPGNWQLLEDLSLPKNVKCTPAYVLPPAL